MSFSSSDPTVTRSRKRLSSCVSYRVSLYRVGMRDVLIVERISRPECVRGPHLLNQRIGSVGEALLSQLDQRLANPACWAGEGCVQALEVAVLSAQVRRGDDERPEDAISIRGADPIGVFGCRLPHDDGGLGRVEHGHFYI